MTTQQHPTRQADRLHHDLLSPAETRGLRDRVRKVAAELDIVNDPPTAYNRPKTREDSPC